MLFQNRSHSLSKTEQGDQPDFNTEKLAGIMADISGQYQDLLQNFLSHQGQAVSGNADPTGAGQAFLELSASLMKNPDKLIEAQAQAWTAYTDLWINSARVFLGEQSREVRKPEQGDRRFKHSAWDENPLFSFIKQSYLVTADAIHSAVADADDLDENTAKKAQFYTKQFVDAMSPTNFLVTNPEVLEATLESKGENLIKGMQNFIDDFDSDSGRLRIKMTDDQAFELGRNVALTPGKVVFQNDLFQLLQYNPSTEQAFRQPLLIIPPWINKYYVLDLQPQNSLIKWLVDQGHTVFVISWVNPDEKLGHKDFEDYVTEGALAAIDAVEKITGESAINLVGYCIGGTLLAATLAYMRTKDDTRGAASATYFVSLIDFSIPGDLGVFIDEQQLESLEKTMNERGYHDGKEMAATFNMLRSNDLIWSFYVRNYLLGKEPFPFDLLYWNADSTRLPARMHSTYLRTMYLNNKFKEPGGLSIAGSPIDVSTIQTPAYFISTEEDHIAPWEGAYLGAQLMAGPVRFVLGKSGHIAGIINPPAANKYGYYTGPAVNVSSREWYDNAELHPGSWWTDWQAWLEQYSGEKIPARQPGANAQAIIEDAPGSYVIEP